MTVRCSSSSWLYLMTLVLLLNCEFILSSPALSANASTGGLSLGSDPWNVDCGNNRLCDQSNPICCVTGENPAFCVEAGQSCCVNLAGSQSGCGAGETCCPSTFGQNPCCGAGTSCTSQGCVASQCASLGDADTCLQSDCNWCCESHRCIPKSNGYCDGHRLVNQSGGLKSCPSNCSMAATCGDCAQQSGCGWCCETQTCMPSHNAQCSYYSWIGSSQGSKCSSCESGGDGLYHVDNASYTMFILTLVLPCVCACCLITVCCQKYVEYRRREQYREFAAATLQEDDSPTNFVDDDEDPAETERRTGVRKYGFDKEDKQTPSDPTAASEGVADNTNTNRPAPANPALSATTCSICMDRPCEIVFLPCYHAYCCLPCSRQIEGRSADKKVVTCPFCRTKVETMVNLNRIFFQSAEPVATGDNLSTSENNTTKDDAHTNNESNVE
eukprot:PhF_6_TR3673/c0_g1_i1/m.5182